MWRYAASCIAGRSHVKAGLPCQDKLRCVLSANNTLLAVIADGAGSASEGAFGAETAINCVIQKLSEAANEDYVDFSELLKEAASAAHDAVVIQAQKKSLEPRELASTLLAVIVGPSGGGALQVGDGVIVVRQEGDGWGWIFWPERGEYANTTYFLTDNDFQGHIKTETLSKDITDIALMTDGLEALALHYPTQTVYKPFFDSMFRPLHASEGREEIESLSKALADFLSSEQVGSRTNDDLSLILATRLLQTRSE